MGDIVKHLRFALALLPALATPAFAHTDAGGAHGFIHGFEHPITGLDHILAMVTVGLFASLLGGRALWAVPASFVTMMLAGAALGIAGLELPAVELGITLSIIVIGSVTALGLHWPIAAAVTLVGFFAIFHGHAHGAEMPLDAGAFGYSAGFASTTLLLHAIGVFVGVLARHPGAIRLAGAAVAFWGLALTLS
jgi:urease accessory protein